MNSLTRGESLPGVGIGRAQSKPSNEHRSNRSKISSYHRSRPGKGRHDGEHDQSDFSAPSFSGHRAGEIDDIFNLGDKDDYDNENSGDDPLLEIEKTARSVGGAAWLAVREAACFFAETTAGLLTETFPEGGGEGGEGGDAPSASREERGRRSRQSASASRARRAAGRRAQGVVSTRAGGVQRAVLSFAQSSANRAGLALACSAANGVLRGAEVAASWAGGDAVAREYVLLVIAAFCLVFRRGVGSSVALLVLIRAGRITVQRLVSEGWAAKRAGAEVAAGANGQTTSNTAAATGGTTKRGSNNFSGSSSAQQRSTVEKGKNRRRPKTQRVVGTNKVTPKAAKKVGGSNRKDRGRRKPLWDESDDESDKGCVVM